MIYLTENHNHSYETVWNYPASDSEDTPPSECVDFQELKYQLQKEIQEAIRNDEYARLPPLYDQLLEASIESLARLTRELGGEFSESDALTLEFDLAGPKSYYLILDGQVDKAIDVWTQIIEKMNACKDKSQLPVSLQTRAAAYLIDGKRELALEDLKNAGRFSYVIDFCGDTVENRIASSHSFEEAQRAVFLRTLEKYLNASLVEVPIATADQLEQMTDWAKADYYLARYLPEEALKFVGNSEERKTLALVQLGHFDEKLLETAEDYDILPLIYFMKGDLENALDVAEDHNSYFMQLLFSYLQKNH